MRLLLFLTELKNERQIDSAFTNLTPGGGYFVSFIVLLPEEAEDKSYTTEVSLLYLLT
jgi:hypothetical protein